MKLSLRFLYLLPVLGLFLSDSAFTEFVFRDEDSPLLVTYGKLLLAGSCGILLFCFRYLLPLMRCWLLVLLTALGALALESYAGWHSWMVYPHVFAKYLVLIHVFAIYAFHRRFGLPPLGLLMGILLLGLGLNLVMFHPESLSLSGFINNERGFDSTSAMLLLLPTLYYLNQYLARGGILRLVTFFAGAALIIFLQHRSVWLALGTALAINAAFLALGRIEGARLSSARLLPMVLIPFLVLVFGGLAAISDPRVLKRLETSIDDIQHADKQGTGSWRLDQFRAYQPFIEAYPIAGMRLEGFELPVQFYHLADNGGSEVPVWQARTGHHFHSFYIDRLFYFGIVGLLLTLLVPMLLLVRRGLSPVPLPPGAVACMVFSFSTLVYGFSYDWPLYFLAVLGLSLAAAAPSRVAVRPPLVPAPAQPTLPSSTPFILPRHAHYATAALR